MQPKVTYYQSAKLASKNIRLLLVRMVNDTKGYFLGVDKNGNKANNYNGYYSLNTLKKL